MMAMAHRGSVKLFGKMIQVAGEGGQEEDNPHAYTHGGGGAAACGFGKEQETLLYQKSTIKPQVQAQERTISKDNPCQPDTIGDKEAILSVKSSTQKEEEEEEEEQEKEEENSPCQSDSQVKTPLKKPDRILPCPRCNSQDTKFCYFNNYNVNQPRHFCRNCQRYWTAGGTMRNVPVGAGRRKNKSATSCHYTSITLSELGSLQASIQTSFPDLAYQTNGTVLSFRSDGPSCESTVPVQDVADKNTMNCCRNGEADENSNGSSVTGSNSAEEGGGASLQGQGLQNLQPQASSCFSMPPWASTWSQASIPVPFYHVSPYWGCSIPNPQNNHWPWVSPQNNTVPKPPGQSSHSGKHSRDGNIIKQSDNVDKAAGNTAEQGAQERCLSVPGTLAIGDPEEAAKSSVWLTMDLKKHKSDWIGREGLCKTFQPKAIMRSQAQVVQTSSEVFHPNPAAWSRSVSFRESL